MSLKAFHILFIVASAILTTLLGFWCFYTFPINSIWTALGASSLFATVGLALYLGWMLKKLQRAGVAALALGMFLSEKSAWACTVCFGNPNSKMAQSANMAMGFFLILVVGVLVAFASLFLYWRARARSLGQ